MSNKHRQPVRSGAAGGQSVRPVSALPAQGPPPAQSGNQEAAMPIIEPREAPKPTPPDPTPTKTEALPPWRARVDAVRSELDQVFRVIPDTWLAKRTRKTTMTARELHRLGFDPKRYTKLGLVEKA